jgi:hypothetical protein
MSEPTGATKDLDPDDPFEPVVARYPVASPVEADREMARCFVAEYALMGWPARRIRRLFDAPFYQGPHAILARNGPAFVDGVIAETLGPAVRDAEDR